MTDSPTSPHPTRLGAYELTGVLGQGTAAVVHRGRHVTSGAPAAIKQLRVDDPADREALRREIAILGRLHHPGLVRVLDHGVEAGTPWYAMELVEGRSLQELWAAAPRVGALNGLRVLQRLCGTLAFIHGEGLVHRDLKPANVVVRPSGLPVLVDFGFAANFAARSGREVLESGGETLGSLAYMAPEQLRGEFVDARADLYALGCMLYESVTGAPPFTGAAWQVAQAQLDSAPPPPSTRGALLSAALEHTVLALLAKAPRARPGYAGDVARVLAEAIGDPPVADAISTAYLYRADFVGRSDALAHLGAALDRSADGHAVCALVAGESGVGKTRLAMEFTRAAAGRRFAVVTGECAPADTGGGGPLHPLQPALRRLADSCRQGGAAFTARVLGARAAVLAAVEPVLDQLPGLEHEPAPAPLPAAAARERLVQALVDTLAAWGHEAPLVVALDDLQWADELTLAVLDAFAATAPASPVFLLGTLRIEDESLALRAVAARPGVARLVLSRVQRPAIEAIVGDMLAAPRPPDALVDFLAAHSEGNPFFISEYLRAAVGAGILVRGELGGWRVRDGSDAAYASLGLPHTLRELIGRRLHDLGPAARALVTAAAVLGRDFDPSLAADLVGLDERARVEGLAELRARQVADAALGARWRFAHDKLREVAYEDIEAAPRRRLHGAAAAALESHLAGDPRAAEQYAALAHHFAAAGAAPRAAEYHGRAGEHALAGGALDAARVQLTAALASAPSVGGLDVRRAHWLRLLAEADAGTNLGAAIVSTSDALRLLGQRVPRHTPGWAAQLVVELVRRGRPPRRLERATAIEAAHAASRAANSFYFQFDVLPGVVSSLRCIGFAAAAGEPGRAALPYAQLGYVAGGVRLHRVAARCFARAHALRDAVAADPSDFAAGLYFHAMYEMGFGHWARSEALAAEAGERLTAIGNHQEAEVAGTVLANTLYYAGQLVAAEARSAAVLASAARRGHEQHLGWGLFLQGRSRLALGNVAAAREAIERGYARLLPTKDFVSLVMCEGLLCRARWCDGDAAGAARAADALATRLAVRRIVPLAQCLDGYWAHADVRLRLWAAARTGANAAAAGRAGADLRRFARLFPIARPAAARAQARRYWLLGHHRRARRAWQRSLRLAHALAMPYDAAGALLDLAVTDGDAARRAAGQALLANLGCTPDAAQLEGFAP